MKLALLAAGVGAALLQNPIPNADYPVWIGWRPQP
jgi:hypothetical protein